jgi:hypothetical protein
MALAEDTVAGVELQLFELDYKLTVRARAANTRILSENTIDLPLESMVVGGAYNDITHRIELTLQNGNVVSFPVDELVSGLISSSEKGQPNGVASLDADGKVPKEQLPDDIGSGCVSADLSDYVKFTDYATSQKAGVVKVSQSYGLSVSSSNGTLSIAPANESEIEAKTQAYKAITPKTHDKAWKVSATTNTETFTDEEKAAACETIGAVERSQPASGIRLYAANNVKQTYIDLKYEGLMLFKQNNIVNVPFGDFPDKFTLTDEQKAKWRAWLGIE